MGAEKVEHESYKAAKKVAMRGSKGTGGMSENVRRTLGFGRGSESGIQDCKADSEREVRCDGVSCLKDKMGQIVVDPDGIKVIWKRYMEML